MGGVKGSPLAAHCIQAPAGFQLVLQAGNPLNHEPLGDLRLKLSVCICHRKDWGLSSVSPRSRRKYGSAGFKEQERKSSSRAGRKESKLRLQAPVSLNGPKGPEGVQSLSLGQEEKWEVLDRETEAGGTWIQKLRPRPQSKHQVLLALPI